MKKINGIKLFFAALPLIVIALLLFIRFYRSTESYKSLANWGKGNMGFSESAYYNNRVLNIITEWQRAGKNIDTNKNNTYLLIDLEKNAIWLEENGQVKNDYYFEFPKQNSWILNYSSPQKSIELPKRTILYIKEKEQQLTGQFYLYGNITKQPYSYNFDTIRCYMGLPPPLSIKSISPGFTNAQDYTSLVIGEEEYKKYKDSLVQTNSEQSDENETFRRKTLEDNILKWGEIEKYLYMEIDGQIQNAGYELSSLEVQAGPDYTCAFVVLQGHGENVIYKLLDLGGGSKTVRAYIKIDYLKDNVWYARTAPHPRRKLESDRKLNLEFLIFPDEQIPRQLYKKYIIQGRTLQRSESFLSSKWKTTLPNGVIVEILGIRNSNAPEKWWGPDGGKLEFPDYFTIESLNKDDKIFEIAWQVNWPVKKERKQMFFSPEGAKNNRSVNVQDRYGNTESVMISVFDDLLQKTDFRIGIKENDNTYQYTIFKNISFIEGKNQGFEIETQEK